MVGSGTINATVNTGRLFIALKPRDERKASASAIIDRLRERTKGVEGISLFMQAVQDVQIDSRVSRTQYQYTLQDADEVELSQWAAKLLNQLRSAPSLTDVASDEQPGGLQVNVVVDREKAARLNILPQAIDDTLYDAFGQRQVSTIFTQLTQYRVILEAEPQFQLTPKSLSKIYVKSTTGQAVPLNTFATIKTGTAPLTIAHQGQFPAVTLSFNLHPGASLGHAVDAIQKAEKQIGLPETVVTTFSGSAAEFRSSLKSEPFLIFAAIIVIYIVLGVCPLALQRGEGSELRGPMGIAIVGGLLLSQFITFYPTPVVYLYMDRFGRRFHRGPSAAHLRETAADTAPATRGSVP